MMLDFIIAHPVEALVLFGGLGTVFGKLGASTTAGSGGGGGGGPPLLMEDNVTPLLMEDNVNPLQMEA